MGSELFPGWVVVVHQYAAFVCGETIFLAVLAYVIAGSTWRADGKDGNGGDDDGQDGHATLVDNDCVTIVGDNDCMVMISGPWSSARHVNSPHVLNDIYSKTTFFATWHFLSIRFRMEHAHHPSIHPSIHSSIHPSIHPSMAT
jgi:hypothetical protein